MNIHFRNSLRLTLQQKRKFYGLYQKESSNIFVGKRNFSTKSISKFDHYFKVMSETINKQKQEDLKVLSDNIEAENYHLSKKVKQIMESNDSEDVKTLNIINEVNNVNMKSTEQLLNIHQRYIFNYNYNFIEFILVSYEKIIRVFSPKTLFFFLSLYFGYKFVQTKYFVKKNVEGNEVVKFYKENFETIFKNETILPVFVDHKNITNLVNNGKFFLLVGPKGIGKSYSIKHFCLQESQKDSLVIYKDLNAVNDISNLYEFIVSNLIEFYKKSNGSDSKINTNSVFEELKGAKVIFVLDHFSNQPHLIDSIKNITDILKSHNVTIILVSNSSESADFAYQADFNIKQVDEKIEEKVNNYLLDNVNHLIKSVPRFANCELFTENNIKTLRKSVHLTFETLLEYLNLNSSIKSFIEHRNDKITQKLKLANLKSPESIQILKEIRKLNNKPQEWTKIKDIKNYQSLLNLENNDIIAIRNTDEIKILHPATQEILNRV